MYVLKKDFKIHVIAFGASAFLKCIVDTFTFLFKTRYADLYKRKKVYTT